MRVGLQTRTCVDSLLVVLGEKTAKRKTRRQKDRTVLFLYRAQTYKTKRQTKIEKGRVGPLSHKKGTQEKRTKEGEKQKDEPKIH